MAKPANALSPRQQDPDPPPVHRRRSHDRHVEQLMRVSPDVELARRPPLGDPSRKGRGPQHIESAHRSVVTKGLSHRRFVSPVEREPVQRRGEPPGTQGREQNGTEGPEARRLEELEQGDARGRRSQRDRRPEVEVGEEGVALEAVDDLVSISLLFFIAGGKGKREER